MMWPELFGPFWGLVALTVIVVALAYIVLILLKTAPMRSSKDADRGGCGYRSWRLTSAYASCTPV